jgi:hypothetical protein
MGFSLVGTLIGVVLMLPSVLFFALFPPANAATSAAASAPFILTMLERVGQAGCLAVLVLSRSGYQHRHLDVWAILMMLCIVLYYCAWIRYVLNGRELIWLGKSLMGIPIPLAVLPICAFGFAALWGRSVWLGIATVILAAGHIPISWRNLR